MLKDIKGKRKVVCWAIFRVKTGKLGFYDSVPLFYRSKKRAEEEQDWQGQDVVRKVRITIEEI